MGVTTTSRSRLSPAAGAAVKVERTYSGLSSDACVPGMLACDAEGLLMVNLTKMYHKPDCESFDAFGRVLSGTLRVGDEVKVLGESYSLDDQEDSATKVVYIHTCTHSCMHARIRTQHMQACILDP